MIDPERIPVIVGIGECIDRDNRHEPRTLLAKAAHLAGAEAAGLLQYADSIDVVSIISCQYDDIGQLLAQDLGISPERTRESFAGGEKPVRLLGEAAQRVASGASQVALVCGAEALGTLARATKEKTPLDWGPVAPNARQLTALDFVTPHAARYGLVQPAHVYPLYENATRHAWGQTFEQAQQESGQIWSRNAEVAQHNPTAWLGKPHSAEQIVEDSPGNRMIAYPYRKLMVANPLVNQAGAILITSLARARTAGIPASQIVYIWSGTHADEPKDFLKRDRFDRSTAQQVVLQSTLDRCKLPPAEVDLVEFYSCFPVVPKMARRTLELPPEKQLSLAGGLTFYGGPANNYMTHALAAAVRELRNRTGQSALIYGQGEFVTKHAAIVLATTPPSVSPQMCDVQACVDATMGAQPQLLDSYEGTATIETFTVLYDRNAAATHAPVVARTPAGDRTVALIPGHDLAAIAWLLQGDAIGCTGHIRTDASGLLRFYVDASS
ncbi:hypothetical protein [Pseudomonas bharatica]|uniref:hypothetical protein n=1 Tax=Pseudomonas bharatica TaxID=2692112 RepID=UPI003B27F92F